MIAAKEISSMALSPGDSAVPPEQSGEAALDIQNAVRAISVELEGLEALRSALQGELGVQFNRAVNQLLRLSGNLIVTGMGKSGHIGRKLAATLASTGTPAHFVHPADASHGDLGVIRSDDAVIALSWSGESAELSDIVAYTRRFHVPLIAMTSRAGSALARAADIAMIMPDVPEACPNGLAPTTSTTVQLVLGDALAVCLLSRRNFTSDDFGQFHPGGKLGARLRRVGDLMHRDDAVPIVSHGDTIHDAILEMTSKRLGVTGVVDERGALIGVISDGDLRRAFKAGLNEAAAVDIMGRSPRTISPEALAEQAMARMNAERITSLFIVDRGRPVGIIAIHDLLQLGIK
jgi:arabinose-5-phosphate isomerase